MSANDVSRMLVVAQEAAVAAGKVLREQARSNFRVQQKGYIDYVTEIDLRSEKIILDRIRSAFPDHAILAEEEGASGGDSPFLWIIDPLDGTTNYAHGYPAYCVSIALEIEGELAVGVIHDPVLDELCWAERGGGAYLNGEAVRVSDRERLVDSLLSTGFSYNQEALRRNLEFFRRFMLRAAGVRRDGSAARNLFCLACGRFDGVWQVGLNPWDVAAGILLIKEAGGRVTDFQGGPCTPRSPELVLSNGRIHEAMMEVLNHWRETGPEG
jgi:myo-inositol-1(or 4)-monophosphatase